LPHKKPIALETDARKMKSFARLGGLKEAPASIGGEYFTIPTSQQDNRKKNCKQKGSCQIAEIHCKDGEHNG